MPNKFFRVPHGEGMYTDIPIEDALRDGILDDRWPRSYLRAAADTYPWKGKATVTQCLNGTRKSYLEIICDWAVEPDSAAFRIVGTKAHGALEKGADGRSFAEVQLSDDDVSGRADLIELTSKGWTLYDYKTWGSFKVAKVLGLREDRKNKTVVHVDPEWEGTDMQVNKYRVMWNREHPDKKIERMFVFCPVRDGSTWLAKKRGITENTYMLAVPELDDEWIDEWFRRRARRLVDAVESRILPPLCSPADAWEGRRCRGYCAVAEHCEENPWLKKS